LLDELIDTTRTRYAAGSALKQDALQAEVERAGLDKQLLRLHQQQVSIQARINALLNRSPDAPLPAAAPTPVQSSPPALEIVQTLALGRHPELLGLDAKISASNSRVTVAEKAFYPDFQLGVGYNSLWDNSDKRPGIGVSINVPLNRSKRKSELDRARAESRRAGWMLAERRAELLSNVAQARARVIEAQDSVVLYQDRLAPLAEEFFTAALADYQSGSGTFLNVIIAEQRKLTTDLELARAHADAARRIAELEQWTGGPFRFSMPAPNGALQ
jgi:outer membrane protein, heavy metal efflux system